MDVPNTTNKHPSKNDGVILIRLGSPSGTRVANMAGERGKLGALCATRTALSAKAIPETRTYRGKTHQYEIVVKRRHERYTWVTRSANLFPNHHSTRVGVRASLPSAGGFGGTTEKT